MNDIILILNDIRSTHNVGSILRTAECLGISHVYFCGYTPYPLAPSDSRLPHISAKLNSQIHKTALGAEKIVKWSTIRDISALILDLKSQGFCLAALEQSPKSVALNTFVAPSKIAVILGNEVTGVDPYLLDDVDTILEIPQFGKKESLNVTQAAAICLYHLRFSGK